MVDLWTIIPALSLLLFLLWERRKRQAWQAHYDAVEETAIRLARARKQNLPLRRV